MLEDMGSVEMQHVIRRHLREENPPPSNKQPFSSIFSDSESIEYSVASVARRWDQREEKPRAAKRTSISPCTFWILE